jgi:hypothetical protein
MMEWRWDNVLGLFHPRKFVLKLVVMYSKRINEGEIHQGFA